MNTNPTNPNAKPSDEEFVKSIHPNAFAVMSNGWLWSVYPDKASGCINTNDDSSETELSAWADAASRLRAEEGMKVTLVNPTMYTDPNNADHLSFTPFPNQFAEEGIGEAKCPSCKTGRNSRSLGGNERCFHCDSCGFVNCIENCPDPTLNQSDEGKPTESAQQWPICGHCGQKLTGGLQRCSNDGWCSVEGQPEQITWVPVYVERAICDLIPDTGYAREIARKAWEWDDEHPNDTNALYRWQNEAIRQRRDLIALQGLIDYEAVPSTPVSAPQETFMHGLTMISLLERAVRGARAYRTRGKHPRWIGVCDTFALGSTYASDLCKKFDLDPDEEVKR